MVNDPSQNTKSGEKKSFIDKIKENWVWVIVGSVVLVATLSFVLPSAEEDPEEMVSIEQMTLDEAKAELRELDSELEIIKSDYSGEERSVVLSRNWKVCSQSIPAGEQIADGKELEIAYTRIEEDCENPESMDREETEGEEGTEESSEGESSSDSERATVLGTMPDVVGMTVSDATETLQEISRVMSRERVDITGENRTIWRSENWVVCSQSIDEGEDILSTETLEITYDREQGGCLSPDDWVEIVSGNWSNPRDDISIESMSSDAVGVLKLHIGSSELSDPETANWAENNLDQMINLELPNNVAEVRTIRAYSDGDRIRSDVTTEGMSIEQARLACDRRFENTYGNQDVNARWILESRGYHLVKNGSGFQMAAGGTIEDNPVEVVCEVSGSNVDDASIEAFEVR